MLSSIADRMNISKADILNPESDNAAVKLALAETHVINETKAFLESQGVILSAFSSRARSDTTILVKNIPYGTTASQIRELFEPHGKLERVVVPPAGTMAIVEFVHADDARRGFRAVAYRRLGNSVIYLEKGPLGMFREIKEEGPSHVDVPTGPVSVPEQNGYGDEEISEGTTLFVKNLSFSTTTDRLNLVFRSLPGFAFARVQTKPDPKRPGAPRLSMGYGFVGFKTLEAAKKALKGLNGCVLDGHALNVKFAGRGKEEESKDGLTNSKKSRTTKMVVKNVPFEASKKDIRELFGYGCTLSIQPTNLIWSESAPKDNSSLCGCQRNSTLELEVSPSLSLLQDRKQKAHLLLYNTPICSGVTWSWSGQTILSLISMNCAGRLALDSVEEANCLGANGNLSLMRSWPMRPSRNVVNCIEYL